MKSTSEFVKFLDIRRIPDPIHEDLISNTILYDRVLHLLSDIILYIFNLVYVVNSIIFSTDIKLLMYYINWIRSQIDRIG